MIASMTTGAELVENFIHQEPDNKLDQLSVIYDQIKAKWGGADIEYAGAIHWSNIKTGLDVSGNRYWNAKQGEI